MAVNIATGVSGLEWGESVYVELGWKRVGMRCVWKWGGLGRGGVFETGVECVGGGVCGNGWSGARWCVWSVAMRCLWEWGVVGGGGVCVSGV